jgi:hypothetical protein
LASPVRYASTAKDLTYPLSQTAVLHPQRPANGPSGPPPVTALTIEFVAKPQEARRVEAAIPASIVGALKDVTGFAGCLVMISDQEARLVTVVTLWAGNDRAKYCSQNVRWVKALLVPYLDRYLRVQTMVAHLPVLQPEPEAAGEPFMIQNLISTDETVCVA